MQELTPFLLCLRRGSCSLAHFCIHCACSGLRGEGEVAHIEIGFHFLPSLTFLYGRHITPIAPTNNLFGISGLRVFSCKFFLCLRCSQVDPCTVTWGASQPLRSQLVGCMRTLLFHSATSPERRVEDGTRCSIGARSHDWIL